LPGSEHNPGWKGKLVTDDFSGYKACFELGVTEVGCMAHARLAGVNYLVRPATTILAGLRRGMIC
jgi:hypothetical protein